MRIIKYTVLYSLGLFFTLLTLMGVGAIAEEHYLIVTQILGILLGHTLFVLISYLAFHFAPVAVVKFTVVNGCIAALSWDEMVNPGEVKDLFSFTKTNVCLHGNVKSFAEILKTIPVCNPEIFLEDKIRFCLNPISLFIASLHFIEESTIYLINFLPQKMSNHESDNSEHPYPHRASHKIYRSIKGVVAMVCNVFIIPLRFIEPIGNIFYKSLYLLIITIPDYFMFVVNHGKSKPRHEHGKRRNISERFFKRYNTHDITDQLK